jgi:hypothetical protein
MRLHAIMRARNSWDIMRARSNWAIVRVRNTWAIMMARNSWAIMRANLTLTCKGCKYSVLIRCLVGCAHPSQLFLALMMSQLFSFMSFAWFIAFENVYLEHVGQKPLST